MNNTQRTLAIASVIAALGAGAAGASTAFAAQGVNGRPAKMSALVNALAEKFHVSPSEVQSVFDQQQKEVQAERQKGAETHLADRLAKAVTAGTLTQAQADAVKAKHAEMQTFMASLAGKTPVERQAAMKTQMDALKTWAAENKIPGQFLAVGPGGQGKGVGKPGRGFGHGMGRGENGRGF